MVCFEIAKNTKLSLFMLFPTKGVHHFYGIIFLFPHRLQLAMCCSTHQLTLSHQNLGHDKM